MCAVPNPVYLLCFSMACTHMTLRVSCWMHAPASAASCCPFTGHHETYTEHHHNHASPKMCISQPQVAGTNLSPLPHQHYQSTILAFNTSCHSPYMAATTCGCFRRHVIVHSHVWPSSLCGHIDLCSLELRAAEAPLHNRECMKTTSRWITIRMRSQARASLRVADRGVGAARGAPGQQLGGTARSAHRGYTYTPRCTADCNANLPAATTHSKITKSCVEYHLTVSEQHSTRCYHIYTIYVEGHCSEFAPFV
jgi:hypothetical protein